MVLFHCFWFTQVFHRVIIKHEDRIKIVGGKGNNKLKEIVFLHTVAQCITGNTQNFGCFHLV